jgi:predicted RNA-binding Zn ribbon-like protein
MFCWYNPQTVKPIQELPFVAGHVALDFVNTAEERGDPRAEDVLLSPADLRIWGRRYGLIGASAKAPDDRGELERALELRELLYRVFSAGAHAQPPAPRDLERLGVLAADGYRAGRVRGGGDGSVEWRWSRSDLASVRHVVATSAVELLRTGPARLKQCPGDQCGWLFLDTTKRGNRRWCQMRECGQEAKDKRRRSEREGREGRGDPIRREV